MATIHITELQRLLIERGQPDARQSLEIRFDDSARQAVSDFAVDEEFKDKVLSVDCPVRLRRDRVRPPRRTAVR
jgi:hypothetical protein